MAVAPDPTFSVVASPPAEPPDVGLIPSVLGTRYLVDDMGEVIDGHENRWVGGFRYAPEQVCFKGDAQDPCSPNMVIPPNPAIVSAMPVELWAGDRCTTTGWAARDFKGRATRGLLAVESKQLAKELWEGTQAQASGWPNRYLASGNAILMSAGPMGVKDALAAVEQGIAAFGNGQRGMVHCTRQMAIELSELGSTFRTANNQILTYVGTVIVPDAGYTGTGPADQPVAAGSQWIYGTLMVTVRRGPITVTPDTFAEATVRGTNLIEWRATRPAATSFPGCVHVACEVNVPLALNTAS